MNDNIFTNDELDKIKDGEIVGYDNGNGEMMPVRKEDDGFYCSEYDYSYSLEELTPDWFVKAYEEIRDGH